MAKAPNNHSKTLHRLLFGSLLAISGCATTSTQKQFNTPDQACAALVRAADEQSVPTLLAVLGPDGKRVVNSGDDVADRGDRARFVRSYREGHALQNNPDGSMTLLTGKNSWPMPIPIVHDAVGRRWHFDTARGVDAVLDRRIGRDELDAIQTCLAVADAEEDYVDANPTHAGVRVYARRFLSHPGQRDGLYWETGPDDPSSPLGPLVADASLEGYSATQPLGGKRRSFHGYRFRILTSQTQNADGGAWDYLVGDRMIGGFAVVAYPAQYGVTGVMTFIMNQQRGVYQRDLGQQTTDVAEKMTSFDPAPGWTLVDTTTANRPATAP